MNPDGDRAASSPSIYQFLWNKWYFDELYEALFVQPVMFVSRRVAEFDRTVIDRFIDWLRRWRCAACRRSTI